MAWNVYTERTAKQISSIFLSGLETNTPVVFLLFWTCPSPRGAHPSLSKKKLLEGHLVVRPGTLLHTETCLNLVPQWDRLSPPWVGLMDGFPPGINT